MIRPSRQCLLARTKQADRFGGQRRREVLADAPDIGGIAAARQQISLVVVECLS